MMNKNEKKLVSIKVLSSILLLSGITFVFAEKVPKVIYEQKSNNISKNKTISSQKLKENEIALIIPSTEDSTVSLKENYILEENKILDGERDNEAKVPDSILMTNQNLSEDQSTEQEQEKDLPAEYPGGMSKVRNELATKFDTSPYNGNEGRLTSKVYISVNKKGDASVLKIEGENEVFNQSTIKAVNESIIKVKWKPAIKNGKKVASVVTIPFTMEFQ